MSYIIGEIPFFRAYLRKEYTRNLVDGHNEFYPCIVFGVRAIRGNSLWFQCILTEKYGGASFLAPIEAFAMNEQVGLNSALCRGSDTDSFTPIVDMTYIQPWDTFSSDFGVHQFSLIKNSKVHILPGKITGRYHCTLDFANTDLAEDSEQHKHLHICFLDNGKLGAFPNNRVLFEDPAFWTITHEKPNFKSLLGEFRAE